MPDYQPPRSREILALGFIFLAGYRNTSASSPLMHAGLFFQFRANTGSNGQISPALVGSRETMQATGYKPRSISPRFMPDRQPVQLFPAKAPFRYEMIHQSNKAGFPQTVLVDVVTDGEIALQRHHVLENRAGRDGDRRERLAGVFVANVLDEQHHQHAVLVLAGAHAAAQFIAARPQGRIEFGFFDDHTLLFKKRYSFDQEANQSNA